MLGVSYTCTAFLPILAKKRSSHPPAHLKSGHEKPPRAPAGFRGAKRRRGSAVRPSGDVGGKHGGWTAGGACACIDNERAQNHSQVKFYLQPGWFRPLVGAAPVR